MPSNLRDFMNKNNISSSSRESQQFRRMPPIEEQRYNNQGHIEGRFQGTSQQVGSSQYGQNYQTIPYQAPPSINYKQGTTYQLGQGLKYQKSKNECIQQLTRYLEEIDRKDGQIRSLVDSHNSGVLKKFSDEYDNLAQQIIRNVETQLRDNKERLIREITQRRNADLAQAKPIRRNMDKLRSQLTSLRDGLYRENDYRQYISKIVVKDWEMDLGYIQQDIDRLRLPNVDLTLDEKYYSCFKSDLNRLIVVRDQLYMRSNNEQLSYSPQSPNPSFSQTGFNTYTEINPHTNRDQIKRSQANKYS